MLRARTHTLSLMHARQWTCPPCKCITLRRMQPSGTYVQVDSMVLTETHCRQAVASN